MKKGKKSWIRWVGILVILAAVILIAGFAGKQTGEEAPPQLTEDFLGMHLARGSKVPDFVFTDAQGNTHRLYEVLSEKKLVVLNFWYINCMYCVQEFPVMESVYGQYKDKAEIFALTPRDDAAEVRAFGQEYGLSFPMGEDSYHLNNAFGVSGYPTTVFIDRYGEVCLVQVGAMLREGELANAFAYFTAKDYEQVLFSSLSAIPKVTEN